MRFLVLFLTVFFSISPVFGQSASDQLSASISLFPSHEKSVSSSDTLKRLKQQESELASLIKLESARVFSEEETDVEQKRDEFLKQKNAELDAINLQIDRLEELRSDQLRKTIQQVSWYLLIFIFLYFFRVISRSFLARFGRSFSTGHQEVLFLIHNWVFHILFFAALLMILSVEFISFLPFLAILTTAVGFSLREVISSFIGWFVIEADSGYKAGDLIELDTMTGRVKHITPLLTTIEEYGLQGFTGKIISFPNKTIFEKSIKNWSHGSDFLMISSDFLLTYESDITAAKQLLMEVVGYNALPQYYKSRKEISLFKFIYNFTDEDLKPQIHVLTDNKGITLRVRNLVHMTDRFSEQSRIVETFISRVQKEKKVAMQEA